MDEQTPNTKQPSALDKVNARRILSIIQRDLEVITNPDPGPEYGTMLPKLLGFDGMPNDGFTRKQITEAVEDYLDSIKERKAVAGYSVSKIRRQLFRDVYPAREDRALALRVHWRARKTKERLCWTAGEEPTAAQITEFGRLIHHVYYEDDNGEEQFAYKLLRKAGGYIMDINITPVQPVKFITLNMEIAHAAVQFPEVSDHDARPAGSDDLRGDQHEDRS